MKIEVHMRDGRTRFRFAKRAHLRAVLDRDPAGEGARVRGEVKWNRDDEDWTPISIRTIGKSSVSFVVEVVGEDVAGGVEAPEGDER